MSRAFVAKLRSQLSELGRMVKQDAPLFVVIFALLVAGIALRAHHLGQAYPRHRWQQSRSCPGPTPNIWPHSSAEIAPACEAGGPRCESSCGRHIAVA